ncbi:MAG: MlaA family lipoprotein [Planctomycetota bacterium]|jgi:phospholipid-binding lipoprotein MlaA
MALSGLDKITRITGTKLLTCIISVLVVMLAGCAVSEKNPSANSIVKSSPDLQHTLTDSNNAAPAEDSNEVAFEDDEFDFLEDELAEEMVEISDPLEHVNRVMFCINDGLYFWIAKPCALTCKRVIPEPARIGISNFFQNLITPVRFVNCLLQGKGDAAGTERDRFLINTTVGVLGFGDPARDQHGLEPVYEDLGQTLAVAGFENGFYIVWPLLGPSTARDSVGKLGDMFLNPVFYVADTETAIGIAGVKTVNEGSFHIGEYEAFKAEALDPYIAMRDMYIQYRNKKVLE